MIFHESKPVKYAIVVRSAPLDVQRPILIAREPAEPRAPLSRMSRVLIIGCVAMLLYFAGYGVIALCLLGLWGIIGAATRQRDDTSDRIYSLRVGSYMMRFRGDNETDAHFDKRA